MTVSDIRKDFPILGQHLYKEVPLVYFDNASTTQKPSSVIQRLVSYYEKENANIHRGIHYLSSLSTQEYESSRQFIQNFLNAKHSHEIIFTRGTTESLNLIAYSYALHHLKKSDEIIITYMEHHANIVPWQLICEYTGASLKVVPIYSSGELDMDVFEQLLSSKTKLVSLVHVSNATGVINPIEEVIKKSHAVGAKVCIDGAQSVVHMPIDVQLLDCDFFCFSGHKLYAPTGIGVLYAKSELLELMNPFHGGGEMIKTVTIEKTTYADLPAKFEAGTPHIAGVLGLQTALKYILRIGYPWIKKHETSLFEYTKKELQTISGLQILANDADRCGLHSFVVEGVHPHDLATLLDQDGIAIRTGHHCAQPMMNVFGVLGTTRVSFALYNTLEECDVFITSLKKAINILR